MPRSATCLSVVFAACMAAAPMAQQNHAIQRSFDGDTVRMDLSAGNYRVVTSPDDRIRVTPLAASGGGISAQLEMSLTGKRADLRVTSPRENADVRIEVPRGVNLDISGRNGSVDVAVADRDQYKRVTATVRNGTVLAPAFDETMTGSGSLDWKGGGERELRIRMDSGRVTLR